MLIVTGASGQLGREIVTRLLERVPADRVGVSVRDPGKVADLSRRGVRVRAGDFANPTELEHAFEGASRVLVVSSNAAASGGDPKPQHQAAFAAAVRAGATRILYTSHVAAAVDSLFPPARDHAAAEEMLAGCGIPWTALRHGFYAESAPMMMGDWQATGVVAAPEDGPVAWTAHADLAEVDALLLAGDPPDGPTPPLTGAHALDLAALACIAGELTGGVVRRDELSDATVAERIAARGLPARVADTALGFFRAARAGEFAAVDATLERLIGRLPATMEAVLQGSIVASSRRAG